MLNVNIGGWKHWNKVDIKVRRDWKVLDIVGKPKFTYDLNSEKPLPFFDNSVDNYYCSHTLEHVKLFLIPALLKEIYRTLKLGGLIRIVVPDVEMAINKYVEKDRKWLIRKGGPSSYPNEYPATLLGCLIPWFYSLPKGCTRSGHNTVFDWETLVYCFQQAGFQSIKKLKYAQCSEVFKGLDFKRHQSTSLYLEAQK